MGDVRVVASWCHGNAAEDTRDTRGWLLGHFIDPAEGVRSAEDVEVKWGVHPSGDKRPEWTADDQRTTLLLLIQGRFRIDLTEGSTFLAEQGDYALWGPGIDHSWVALADSVVLTVRWPSCPRVGQAP
ncbi:MAG TPA: signal peptidase I [Pseudonocardiaceae bacterium]|nr:signal peptidase I [Pseudonocardiaceae bacterium]